MTTQDRPMVLAIEDSSADQEIIRRAFQTADSRFSVRMAQDGEIALDLLERMDGEAVRPDLILLDLNLPSLTGREVLQRIRSNPGLCHIPVIILTTTQAEQEVLECYRLGANCFITKPATFTEFAGLIRSTCSYWFGVARLPLPPTVTEPPRGASLR